MERLAPFSPGQIDPQKHQIGGLRVGESPMNDPGVGIEISTGQRQQAGDQQRLLAGKQCSGSLLDRHDGIPLNDGFGQKNRNRRENDPGGGRWLDLNQ